eukprot:536124-Rhodomonas_salina.2
MAEPGHQQHAELDLRDLLCVLLVQHGVRLEQLVPHALGDAQAHAGVVEVPKREGHFRVRLLDLEQSLVPPTATYQRQVCTATAT